MRSVEVELVLRSAATDRTYSENYVLTPLSVGTYAAGSVKGRRIAAYHGIAADVELAGATFVDEPVVVDGAMVTSRGWPDLPYFMPKFLEVLAAGG